MGNQIWESRTEEVLISLSMLVGIWLCFCLRWDLSKPAGSAKTPKHPLYFQQAPWHFPSSAASRTSTVDLQLDTSFLRLCQREGVKHDEPLQSKAGRCFLCYLLLWMEKMPCHLSFFSPPFIPSPPFFFFHFLPPLCWSENSRKLKCILKWRMFCLAWSKAVLDISGHVLNTHNVSRFLVFKAKFFYHCLRT